MPAVPIAAADPYAYLEDAVSPATVAWTAEQNARTRATLDADPQRSSLARHLAALLRIDTLEVPVQCGDREFYLARRGEAEQAVLFVRDFAGERALLDPAALDPSGLTALDWWYPSPGGGFVAVGLSSGGDEHSTLFVLDAASGTRLSEAIPDTRHCSLAWDGENGFYYTRYPAGGSYDVRLYQHALGTAWEADERIFGDGCRSEEFLGVAISADGRRLVATVFDGWARSDVYVADTADSPLRFATVVEGCAALFDAVPGNETLYVRTDDGAPAFRICALDYGNLERGAWREIVAESRATLADFALAGDGLVLHYLEDARSSVRVRRGDGSVDRVAHVDGFGVTGISARESSPVCYIGYASFVEAPAVVRADVSANPATVSQWARVVTPFDSSAYAVTQEWFSSRDGTRIPLTVIALANLPRDGRAPAVLYGYGGFNISLLPAFSPTIVPWLDAGGVYAIANLRGGGEFGETWHRAGMREQKQNVFDDCIAAVAYLGASGIADPGRIAIMGGSNGGLLVAAVATQRSEMLRAVVCLVPLTDMLRFHKFSIGRLWIPEYGDPDDASDAAFLRAYSPYHNVRDDVAYPAMLVATADGDGRVDPMHARKFGARLQAATTGGPVLVSVETSAGHGAGKPRHKIVAELADRWTFLFAVLDVQRAIAREATA